MLVNASWIVLNSAFLTQSEERRMTHLNFQNDFQKIWSFLKLCSPPWRKRTPFLTLFFDSSDFKANHWLVHFHPIIEKRHIRSSHEYVTSNAVCNDYASIGDSESGSDLWCVVHVTIGVNESNEKFLATGVPVSHQLGVFIPYLVADAGAPWKQCGEQLTWQSLCCQLWKNCLTLTLFDIRIQYLFL